MSVQAGPILWEVADVTARDALVVNQNQAGGFARVQSTGALYQATKGGTGSGIWASTDAASAQATADAALPKAGGTMTGAITLTAEAGAAALVATATDDTPVTTYTAHVASTDPAGYIKITVDGQTRYIPFFT